MFLWCHVTIITKRLMNVIWPCASCQVQGGTRERICKSLPENQSTATDRCIEGSGQAVTRFAFCSIVAVDACCLDFDVVQSCSAG